MRWHELFGICKRQVLPISGDGHRVVHGGEHFKQPALIDAEVVEAIRAIIPLASLHNPANLQGSEWRNGCFRGVPQVAVFDTAFHQTMPPVAFRYALPCGAVSGTQSAPLRVFTVRRIITWRNKWRVFAT